MSSKLDKIFDEMNMANPGAELIAEKEAKKAIKDLFIELIENSKDLVNDPWEDLEKEVKKL